ncbi:ABC transporter ATP-binding protein [Ancylobacter sp. WKF20]|uniref:ABC transporter ATP-binding protein n=1 Tax=Ancylobacter sp. WKF20 TaxID=3039801 RepID=UPI00243441E2|nr:ABC transporter ATP-binding protein [Ancylobacter sp. WKF20]WGD30092.1 ABC transporter ATP-binding protein [Ancylobacter sp. WKF20]
MSLSLQQISLTVGGQDHLRDIDLTLGRGTVNVLLGPTRAGKTSLMRVMAGLDPPTSGRLIADGRDVTGLPVKKRSVAMVYQQFINYPALSVYENIASPLRVRGAPKAEIDRRVREAAAMLKLEAHLKKTPLQLSGGQQQRCAIARAVVRQADLVLLDEPLANLDYKLREELREELPRIFAETNAIFVYATTEPSEALMLGGNTACLSQGRLLQFGPAVEVYRRPLTLAAAQTFSDPPMNVADAQKRDGRLLLPGGTVLPAEGALAALADGPYRIGVRAHHLRLAAGAGNLTVTGTVDVTEITGSESYIHIHAGPLRWVALVAGVHELEPGAPIAVHVDPARLFVFDPDGRVVITPDGAADGATPRMGG